jgi:hypothetical protein
MFGIAIRFTKGVSSLPTLWRGLTGEGRNKPKRKLPNSSQKLGR